MKQYKKFFTGPRKLLLALSVLYVSGLELLMEHQQQAGIIQKMRSAWMWCAAMTDT